MGIQLDSVEASGLGGLGGLTDLEAKVDAYLARIRQLDPALNEAAPVAHAPSFERARAFVSLEKLHRSGPANRHVYFAGVPLAHSLEALRGLRSAKAAEDENALLRNQISALRGEIDALSGEKEVQFRKFEAAVRKATALGAGAVALSSAAAGRAKWGARKFFSALREKCAAANAVKIAGGRRLAVRVIVRNVGALRRRAMKRWLGALRRGATAPPGAKSRVSAPVGPPPIAPTIANATTGPDADDGADGAIGLEISLLTRLEALLQREMQLLN